MSTPILPNAVWLSGTNENSIPANDNSLRAEILNGLVISQVVTAQPASPGDGDIYIIPPGATGTQWSTFTVDDLTIYRSGTWYAYAPVDGVVVNISGGQLQYLGSFGWTPMTALSNPMTTAGDLIVGGGSGAPTRLGIGSDGQVLTIAGGVVVWGAGGGGGLTNWADGLNTSSPNATIPVASFTATNAAPSVDAAILPKGTGALLVSIPDNTATGGIKRGTGSADLQRVRSNANQVAAAIGSFVVGGNNSVMSNSDYGAAVGFGNTLDSATYGFSAGQLNMVNASYGVAMGTGNVVNGIYGAAFGNTNTVVQGAFSYGNLNTAGGLYSFAGGQQSTARSMIGTRAYASGQFASLGDSQERSSVLRRETLNATPVVLSADDSSPTSTNQLTLPNGSAFLIRADVIAREAATGDCKSWEIRVTLKRGANAAATSVVGSAVVTVADADAGASAWTIAATADTTRGGLSLTATGEAAKDIVWVARVRSVEVAS